VSRLQGRSSQTSRAEPGDDRLGADEGGSCRWGRRHGAGAVG